MALDWFISYLSKRSFSVRLGGASGSCESILGPLLFIVYMLPLGQIMRRHNIDFHCYADDMQLYILLQPGKTDVSCILSCLAEINNWMSENVLQLNDSKSDIVIMCPSCPSTSNIAYLSSSLGALSNNVRKEARNLGVIFDSELSFHTQVTKVVQCCCAQLRQLMKIRSFLSSADLKKLIHAFISSRLDYCNALYSGFSTQNIQRLQLIQNAAARFLACTKNCDHITPIPAALHWLPVSFSIDFTDFTACF